MALSFTTQTRNNLLDEVTAQVDAATASGILRIYSGTRPSNPATAVSSQSLLAELTLSDPSFPAATGGTMNANPISDDPSANATGTATWFRISDSDGNAVVDGDVGTSGADLNLSTTSLAAGVTISISSLLLTAGNA